ncbi:MAG TPA: DUF5678 domain-containing protein [Planctomycetota bacterium]|nr:DUF5678 domain-containing protein [Planctomycetota bacterium]
MITSEPVEVELSAPRIRTIADVPPPWHKETEAFDRMFDELLKNYENKYVAICGGQVVASGDDEIKVATEAIKKYGKVPIFVHLVSATPPKPKRILPPRVVRRKT